MFSKLFTVSTRNVVFFLKSIFKLMNVSITRYSRFQELLEIEGKKDHQKFQILVSLPRKDTSKIIDLFPKSKSQFFQDLFVLSELDFKRNGYFVEFGATDGITHSNSFLLEKDFGWKGILVEPTRYFYPKLLQNRPNALTENLIVWSESNSEIEFNETLVPQLSTINRYSNFDLHKLVRKRGIKSYINTISLLDLLRKHSAPFVIDYLSIDTEGSEFEILNAFDFTAFQFNIITCEHNFSSNRKKIFDLLTQNGYTRKYSDLSQYDDWYILGAEYRR